MRQRAVWAGLAGLVLLGAGERLWAQTAAAVQIVTDENMVVVGRAVPVRAVVRDAAGNVLPNATVTWTIDRPAEFSLQGGELAARGIANCRVTARSGGAVGETFIQSVPTRVEISPETSRITIGGTQQFIATAFDADGNPIPNVAWTWSVTNQRQGGTSLVRVTTGGIVTAVAEGGSMVWATYTYPNLQAGQQRQISVAAMIETSMAETYRLRRLHHNLLQPRQGLELRARQSMLYATNDGQLFFNGFLSGLAGGLLNWQNGRWRAVSLAGQPRFANGSFATEFFSHSITRDGQILAHEDTNINGRQISLGNRDGVFPLFSNNVPLGDTENTNNAFITRNSLTTTGTIVSRHSFRYLNTTTNFTGLFRGFNYTPGEILVETSQREPVMGPNAFSIDNEFGIAGDGTAIYSLTSGTTRAFFRHRFAENREKLIATGDPFRNTTVRSFLGPSRGNMPTFWADENGDVLLAVIGNDNTQHLVHFAKDGTMSTTQWNTLFGIAWYDPAQGALLYGNAFNNRGNGIWLWKPGKEPVSIFQFSRPLADGETIQDFESGTMTRQGRMFLMARTDKSVMAVYEFGLEREPKILFRSGDQLDLSAPISPFTFVQGARIGQPHTITGGTTASFAEHDGENFQTSFAAGQRMVNNAIWFGGNSFATANSRKSPWGQYHFVLGGQGIMRMPVGEAPQLVVRGGQVVNGVTMNTPSVLEVNSSGQILFNASTSAGDTRFYLFTPDGPTSGTIRQLLVYSAATATATTLDGRIASGFDHMALDDLGRVMISLRFRNLGVPVLYLYENETWRRVAEPNVTTIGSQRITNIPNLTRAAGDTFQAAFTAPTGGAFPCQWDGNEWRPIAEVTTTMPHGQVFNNVSFLDVNRRGDSFLQHNFGGNNFLMVRRGGRWHKVLNLFRPTPDGDYLIRVNAVDFRDDGTVYFLAMTVDDETVLYEAKPIE